jgi:cobalamin-dependent methionine synthase I
LGFAAEAARTPEAMLGQGLSWQAMLGQGYRGSRYSFGYPAGPTLTSSRREPAYALSSASAMM